MSTDPAELPYYAARSLLRMFVALGISVVFTFVYALPGIGSYVATATADGDLGKVLLAIGVMIVMVIGVNVLFWRPLTPRWTLSGREAVPA